MHPVPLVIGLSAAFIVVGLSVRRLDVGVFLLLGVMSLIASILFAASYFYL